jgi:hypothetical protein
MRQTRELRAVGEKSDPREQPVPVVNLTPHERKHHGLGVAHVAGHVQKVLSQPHPAHTRIKRSARPEELKPGCDGEDELAERPSEHPEGLSEEAEEDVARLVKEKVCAVEKVIVVGKDEPCGVGNQGQQEKRTSRHPIPLRRMPPVLSAHRKARLRKVDRPDPPAIDIDGQSVDSSGAMGSFDPAFSTVPNPAAHTPTTPPG